MKQEVRKHRQGALTSLSQYRLKVSDGILATTPQNSKSDNASTRYGVGMPCAYSTMSDTDDFFRKQKQMDVAWRQKKENALKKLHMYRRAYLKSSTAGSGKNLRGGEDNQLEAVDNSNDDEVFSSLVMVHAELVQFFTAFSSAPDPLYINKAAESPLHQESPDKQEKSPNTAIINEVSSPTRSENATCSSRTVPRTTLNNAEMEIPITSSELKELCLESEACDVAETDHCCSSDVLGEAAPGALDEETEDEPVDIPEVPPSAEDVQGTERKKEDGCVQETANSFDVARAGDEKTAHSKDDIQIIVEEPINSGQTEPAAAKLQAPDVDYSTDAQTYIDMSTIIVAAQQDFVAKDACCRQEYFIANSEEEKKDESSDALDTRNSPFVVKEGLELLDPFSEPRQSFDHSEQLGTHESSNTGKKGFRQEDLFPSLTCNTELHCVVSSIPVSSPMPTVDSSVSSMGSSIDERSIGSGRLSRSTSASSLSSFWDLDKPVDNYNEALMCSEEQYLPNLHGSKGPCERCLSQASEKERAIFRLNGRHVRIMLVRGGCKRTCTAFPKREDEPPVRLCRICYFNTHRKPRSPRDRCPYP